MPSTGSTKLVKWYLSRTRVISASNAEKSNSAPRRMGLGQELDADRIQRRRVLGADAVFGEDSAGTSPAPAAARRRSSDCGSGRRCPRRHSPAGFDVVSLRQGEVPYVQLDRHGGRPALGLQRQRAGIVARRGVLAARRPAPKAAGSCRPADRAACPTAAKRRASRRARPSRRSAYGHG